MKNWTKPAVASGIVLVFILAGMLALDNLPSPSPMAGETAGLEQPSESSLWNEFYDALGPANGGINVTINETDTNRLNRDCLITVDANRMLEANGGVATWTDVTTVYVNITYPNATVRGASMQETAFTNVFTFHFRTNLTSYLGTYQFELIPAFGSLTFSNFDMAGKPTPQITINNITPFADVILDKEFIYRNQTISFVIVPFDAETQNLDLDWDLSLKASNATVLASWHEGDEFEQEYAFSGVGDHLLGNYTLNLTVQDADSAIGQKLVVFEVRNHLPEVKSVDYNFTAELKRFSQTMKFEVNMSDYEDGQAELEYVKVSLQNQATKANVTSSKFFFNATTKNYTGTVSLPKEAQLEYYTIIVIARDKDNGMVSYIPVANNRTRAANNIPFINGALINDRNLTQGVSFSNRQNIKVWINATDVEQLTFVKLVAYHVDSDTKVSFFSSISENKTIEFSTSLLSTGTWQLFAAAFDSDNDLCVETLIGTMEITPDIRDETAIIITVLLSIIGGFFLGGFVIWRYANTKLKDIRGELIIKGSSKKEMQPSQDDATKKKTQSYTDSEKLAQKGDDAQKKGDASKQEKQGAPPKPATKKDSKGKTRF